MSQTPVPQTPVPQTPVPQTHVAVIATTSKTHLIPSLPVIRELIRRGHRVTLAVGERLADLGRAYGADVMVHPSILPPEDDPATVWPQEAVECIALLLDEGVAIVPTLLDHFSRDRPDLLLHDVSALAGPVLAGALGVTSMQLVPTFVAWQGYAEDKAEQIAPIMNHPVYQDYERRFTAWLHEYGVPGDHRSIMAHPRHGLVLIPKMLQPNADRVGSAFRFAGPCIDVERERPDEWRAPAGEGPLLYVAFGTTPTDRVEFYRTVIAAFTGSGWRVVMSAGWHMDPAALGALPAGMSVHRWVPQLAVLAEASVFVSHAGMGSVLEALWFGVPVVALPQVADQPTNAERLVELGVGRHLHQKDVTPAVLRDAVESLTSPVVRARAAQLRELIRSTGGATVAADAVEELLYLTRAAQPAS